MQIRRIPAVTHIKILFVEHAQTKCLYAGHNIIVAMVTPNVSQCRITQFLTKKKMMLKIEKFKTLFLKSNETLQLEDLHPIIDFLYVCGVLLYILYVD